jgi:hypothetical protein
MEKQTFGKTCNCEDTLVSSRPTITMTNDEKERFALMVQQAEGQYGTSAIVDSPQVSMRAIEFPERVEKGLTINVTELPMTKRDRPQKDVSPSLRTFLAVYFAFGCGLLAFTFGIILLSQFDMFSRFCTVGCVVTVLAVFHMCWVVNVAMSDRP